MPDYPQGVNTSGLGQWPYPDGSLTPFPPDDFKRLVDRLSLIAGMGVGYAANVAARDAMVTNGDAFPGLRVWVGSLDQVHKYTGNSWHVVEQQQYLTDWYNTGSGQRVRAEWSASSRSSRAARCPASRRRAGPLGERSRTRSRTG
jgi:hypothetical protein